MRGWLGWLWLAGTVALWTALAHADPLVHQVVWGETLSGIAHQYGVSTTALAATNHMRSSDVLRVGRRLVIPARTNELKPKARRARPAVAAAARAAAGGQQELAVPGTGPVYFYEPTGAARFGLRPVIVYLHGRGGNPARDCRRWASVARPLGWLLCPSGPGHRAGGRTWNNDWRSGNAIVIASLHRLREKFGRRVQLYGNTLVGFSEGAFVAMNVGVRSPRTFNRWLILGASDAYLGARGASLIAESRSRLRRVVLLTGARDAVVGGTRRAGVWFTASGVPLRVVTPPTLAHEVALDRDPALYRRALAWLAAD